MHLGRQGYKSRHAVLAKILSRLHWWQTRCPVNIVRLSIFHRTDSHSSRKSSFFWGGGDSCVEHGLIFKLLSLLFLTITQILCFVSVNVLQVLMNVNGSVFSFCDPSLLRKGFHVRHHFSNKSFSYNLKQSKKNGLLARFNQYCHTTNL